MIEPFHVPVVTVPIDARDERVATSLLTNVPVVGNVTEVFPEVTNATVWVLEPIVVLPLTVIVLPVFATPVPPYWPATTVPFQVPVAIVPTDVRLEESTFEASVAPVSAPAALTVT